MFGKNEKVGQAYFKNAKDDELYVTSRFLTLQGEGPYRGMPAFFVRLSKCQLACSFCDTYFDSGDWLTFDELDEIIDDTISGHYSQKTPAWADYNMFKTRDMVLVLTGGEPMLQKNIGGFLKKMENKFRWTQIESNGLVYQDIPHSTTLVVSPKCIEKNGKATKYFNPNKDVLKRANCLKFVMEADPESPYSSIPDWALEWRKETGREVFVSPMNIYNSEPLKSKQIRSEKNDIDISERSTVDEVISFWEPGLLDMKSNQKNHEYAAKYCLQNGLTFNMQLHLFASLA